MKEARILNALGQVDDKYIEEADPEIKSKHQAPVWTKWAAMAACLCLVLGLAIQIPKLFENSGSGPFGNGNSAISESHREDFTPEIESPILEQFDHPGEAKKVYLLRTNDWFLSEKLNDFSQVLTTDIVYVVPGDKQGTGDDMTYSFYDTNESGELVWLSSAYPPANASVPFGFAGLTYEMIDNALSETEYDDYIITYSQSLKTVFVWVRSTSEDLIITYPTRPDLLNLENGGVYKLEELQSALTEAYENQ